MGLFRETRLLRAFSGEAEGDGRTNPESEANRDMDPPSASLFWQSGRRWSNESRERSESGYEV